MSAPASFDEMEAKRQMMISSFTHIANAMRQCVACIEDYTRYDPGNISNATTSQALAQLQNYPQLDMQNVNAQFDSPPATDAVKTAAGAKGAKKDKKPVKEKKIKDPNQPKRPASAYILYQNAVRPTLQAGTADMTYKDSMKRTSEMWKELTPAQKKPYEDRYTKSVEEYLQKDKAYKAGQGVDHLAPGTVDPSALTSQSALHAAPTASSSDSSDTSSDSSDDEPPPPPAPKPVKAPKPTPQTPATLAAAASTPKSGHKEKKRKQKDLDQPAAPITPATGEKKKKKKNKE